MPGLHLTLSQAEQLWQIEAGTCERVLNLLIGESIPDAPCRWPVLQDHVGLIDIRDSKRQQTERLFPKSLITRTRRLHKAFPVGDLHLTVPVID